MVATVENPKVIETSTTWGMKTQTYQVEVPRKDLDTKKQYTFVVNTGINGSKPEKVRSPYIEVHKVH